MKILVLGCLLALVLIFGHFNLVRAQTTNADCKTDQYYPRADGLVTAYDSVSDQFSTRNGDCIIGPRAYVPTNNLRFQIDSYESMVSFYFEQKEGNKEMGINKQTIKVDTLPYKVNSMTIDQIELLRYTGNITVDGDSFLIGDSLGKNKVGVVFVDGDISIKNNLEGKSVSLGDAQNSGLVFIAKGQINIDADVEKIDAVLVSEGNSQNCDGVSNCHSICTACRIDGTNNSKLENIIPEDDRQLVINGSIIALRDDRPFSFNRGFSNNRERPAELINAQVKYLVILKDAMSQKKKVWREL